MLFALFDAYETECKRLLEREAPAARVRLLPEVLHTFNILDARGAISVTERAAFIERVRATLAHECAEGYLDVREALGFPLLPPAERKAAARRRSRARRRLGSWAASTARAEKKREEEVHGGPSVRDRRRGDPGGLRRPRARQLEEDLARALGERGSPTAR